MDTKVLIIGGGPSGLLLSLLLTKNGIDNMYQDNVKVKSKG